MCRSIKVLRVPGQATTSAEVRAAALQFVRKIAGTRKPSRENQAAFERAVEEIAASAEKLLRDYRTRNANGATSISNSVSSADLML
jgi:hypothetical protein